MKKVFRSFFLLCLCALLILPLAISPATAAATDYGITDQKIVITEICSNPTYIDTGDADQVPAKTADVFEYMELINVSSERIDLNHALLKRSTDGYNKTAVKIDNLLFHSQNDGIVEPGDVFVIAIYGGDTYKALYAYSSDEALEELRKGFNDFYHSSISVDNFFVAPAKSDATGATLENAFNFANGSVDVPEYLYWLETATGETLAQVNLPVYYYNGNGMAVNCAYEKGGAEGHPGASRVMGCGACTPGTVRATQLPFSPITGTDYDLKLMEYNICATGNGDTAGTQPAERAPAVIDRILGEDPDVVGLTEVNNVWEPSLKAGLVDTGKYTASGYSSQNHPFGGSNDCWDLNNLILFKTDKFNLIDSGHFWCSSDPTAPASVVWKNPDGGANIVGDFPRCINWVILEDKTTGAAFFFLCAHIDAKVLQARTLSAELIVKMAKEIAGDYPIMMTGDWNTKEATAPYAYLTGNGMGDCKYLTTDADLGGTSNSWGSNKEKYQHILPIDACYVSTNNVAVKKMSVIRDTAGDATELSDHDATIYHLSLKTVKIPEPETEAPTDPTATEVPTESPTEAPVATEPTTETPKTETPATEVPATKPTAANGCGSAVTVTTLSAVLCLGGAVLTLRKKH